jgi:hypothetical protein
MKEASIQELSSIIPVKVAEELKEYLNSIVWLCVSNMI